VSEHRPEHAWRVAEPQIALPAEPGNVAAPFRRPLWLLSSPEPLEQQRGRPRRHGMLTLLEGPERIESGWWDGADVTRDYYLARDTCGARLWIYRDACGARGWFLHGVFG
jgi:protein ImuB